MHCCCGCAECCRGDDRSDDRADHGDRADGVLDGIEDANPAGVGQRQIVVAELVVAEAVERVRDHGEPCCCCRVSDPLLLVGFAGDSGLLLRREYRGPTTTTTTTAAAGGGLVLAQPREEISLLFSDKGASTRGAAKQGSTYTGAAHAAARPDAVHFHVSRLRAVAGGVISTHEVLEHLRVGLVTSLG